KPSVGVATRKLTARPIIAHTQPDAADIHSAFLRCISDLKINSSNFAASLTRTLIAPGTPARFVVLSPDQFRAHRLLRTQVSTWTKNFASPRRVFGIHIVGMSALSSLRSKFQHLLP